jgi:hypothetical protein
MYICMYTFVYEGIFVVNQGMNTHNNGPMKEIKSGLIHVFIYVFIYISPYIFYTLHIYTYIYVFTYIHKYE